MWLSMKHPVSTPLKVLAEIASQCSSHSLSCPDASPEDGSCSLVRLTAASTGPLDLRAKRGVICRAVGATNQGLVDRAGRIDAAHSLTKLNAESKGQRWQQPSQCLLILPLSQGFL